jgi:hypothetical protein
MVWTHAGSLVFSVACLEGGNFLKGGLVEGYLIIGEGEAYLRGDYYGAGGEAAIPL